jgi:hypothetical protein
MDDFENRYIVLLRFFVFALILIILYSCNIFHLADSKFDGQRPDNDGADAMWSTIWVTCTNIDVSFGGDQTANANDWNCGHQW